MRLPKWVVKWVKDNFTLEDAERIIKKQELEIERLKKQLNRQRFYSLPKEEIEWVKRTFDALGYNMFYMFWTNPNEDVFIEKYLSTRDEEKEKEYLRGEWFLEEELPF